MSFFYTPFERLIKEGIAHGNGACASPSSGQCLRGWPEISVVAHCDADTYHITDNHNGWLNAQQLVAQMRRQGLGRNTRHIYLHACNGGGSNFERSLEAALQMDRDLHGITVSGYAGKVGRIPGVGAAMEPAGYSRGTGGNRNARVGPSGGR